MARAGWECRELSGPATCPGAPTTASGVTPSRSAFSRVVTTSAAAPSLSGEELPAVMVRSCRKRAQAGQRLGRHIRTHALVALDDQVGALALRDGDRRDLVVEETVGGGGGGPLMTGRGDRILVLAADPELGDRTARWTRPSTDGRRRRSGRRRPPSRARSRPRRPSPCGSGEQVRPLDIDSWPPAMTRSASPDLISRAASITAVRPERQILLMVMVGTSQPIPAATAAWRAGPCPAPAWIT